MSHGNRFAPSSNGAVPPPDDATQLLERFQRVERAWKKAEEILAATLVPIDVRVKVRDGLEEDGQGRPHGEYAHYLSFAKIKGSKRICWEESTLHYGDPDSEWNCRPIVECPVDIRLEMFNWYEKLYEEVKSVAKSYIPKIDEAVAKFELALEFIDI